MGHVPRSYEGIWTLDGAVPKCFTVSLSHEAAAGCACALLVCKPAEKGRGALDSRDKIMSQINYTVTKHVKNS